MERLSAELAWVTQLETYIWLGPTLLDVAPDSSRVVVGLATYDDIGFTEYALGNGALVASGPALLFARDQAWQRELRDGGVFDRRSGERLLALDSVSSRTGLLSADGRHAVGFECSGTAVTAARYAVGVGRSPSRACNRNPQAAITDDAAAVVHTTDDDRILYRNFDTGDERSMQAPSGFNGMAFAPGARSLAVSSDGALRLFTVPDFEPIGPVHVISTSDAYVNCYCGGGRFAPIAWSPDARWIATLDSERNIAIRRGCDGRVLLSLPRSETISRHRHEFTDNYGAVALAFTPDSRGLLALFEAGLAYYALRLN